MACSNAPRRAAGTVLVGTATDLTGSLLFGLGVRFHVSAASSLLLTLSSQSDEAGIGLTALPIPADAGLQGVRLYAQAVWIEDAANGQASSRAALGLVASRGLEVTLQQ